MRPTPPSVSPSPSLSLSLSLSLTLALSLLAACTSSAKASETRAIEHVDRLVHLVDDDVDEVRRGLPHGAKQLSELWRGSGQQDASRARRALQKARSDDRDLEGAQSTFFAIADETGSVLRSDVEPDVMASKSITSPYPALVRALSGEIVETSGSMLEAQGAANGADEQWVTAAPIRDDKGVVRGLYVTGWSLRRHAGHLEEALRHDFAEAALREQDTRFKQPLLYVFEFSGSNVYGAPRTPMLDVQALQGLDLAGKTAGDVVFHQQIDIAGRVYGLAARRTPKLGAHMGVAVIRSEL